MNSFSLSLYRLLLKTWHISSASINIQLVPRTCSLGLVLQAKPMLHHKSKMVIVASIVIVLASLANGFGQKIISAEPTWSDSFKEWTYYTEGDSIEGSLSMVWKLNNDWSNWKLDMGEFYASAKLKYSDNPNFWEFKSGNEIVTAKTIWSGDFSEWRLSDGQHTIKLKSKYRDLPIIWYSEGENYGYMDIFLENEDDIRYWVIEDELNENISELYSFAMIFLSIYHSTPKF